MLHEKEWQWKLVAKKVKVKAKVKAQVIDEWSVTFLPIVWVALTHMLSFYWCFTPLFYLLKQVECCSAKRN